MVASNGSGIPERVLSASRMRLWRDRPFLVREKSDVTGGKSSAPPSPFGDQSLTSVLGEGGGVRPPACLVACGSLGHPFPQSLIKHRVT